ncbi:Hsp20/alpha crystallin family protein [Halobaculum litoreum]|uniref:Hsp20/alpha crystallin family protein n=1 Tax=Halobaculum litoreum TaxID=3031998 RepID=A0ABD5XWS7_9EURY
MSSFPFNQEQPEPSQVGQSTPAAQSIEGHAGEYATGAQSQPVTAMPSIDLVDTADEIIAYVDLPGFDADGVRVRIDGQTLVIDAHREGEIEETDTVVVSERPRAVERVVALPAVVRAGGAEAELNDGVCMISLPKAATDRYEEIRVDSD